MIPATILVFVILNYPRMGFTGSLHNGTSLGWTADPIMKLYCVFPAKS